MAELLLSVPSNRPSALLSNLSLTFLRPSISIVAISVLDRTSSSVSLSVVTLAGTSL